ncbi:MAG: threonine ammonia-lyase [Gemmatimonadota bacterium]|nr:MAG: threonine ammonia-lyase [Gemmatimonadota bacterium]
MSTLPDPNLVSAAAARIAQRVHRTPLVGTRSMSDRIGAPLYLKCENLQKTGSFKVRGALNQLLLLDREARERGVVTVSAGNHAQAVAWAAGETGARATVVMPDGASRAKVEASRSYGAEVVIHGNVHEAFEKCHDLAEQRALTFVHPFDDPLVIAGQGTTGLEIVEELPDLAIVVVPVGGGGLASGIALGLAATGTEARLYGVEPEGACAMRRSFDQGSPARLDRVDTIADGLAPPMAGDLTFAILSELAEDIVLVTDDEIREALSLILTRTKLLVEPAGAAAVAALLSGRIPTDRGPVVAILSGGNVGTAELASLLTHEDGLET